MLKKFNLTIILALSLLLAGCVNTESSIIQGEVLTPDLKIVTSFYPLYEFTKNITGESVSVTSLVPMGAEPHAFEPSPRDLTSIYEADLFIYNGAGIDAWAAKISADLIKQGIPTMEMSEYVTLLGTEDHDQHEDDHEDEDHDQHEDDHEDEDHDQHEDDHGEFDPHFWLDPVIASSLIDVIQEKLSTISPELKSGFIANAKEYKLELAALNDKYTTSLSSCELNKVVTSHSAFNYLAARYGFEIESIAGISPESDPSPARIAELAEFVAKNNIKYIFFETLASPKIANTLASEANIDTLIFNPIEGLTKEQTANGENYLTIMNQNLEALVTGLNCNQ
jgi:zinc transport system substrate-binding protein